jgi:uncharacterized DUF497 family protein
MYGWTEHKRKINLEKHGVDFKLVEFFEWEGAEVFPDRRKEYPEERLVAYGRITGRLHCLVFTVESGRIHVISLRKANKKEVKRYG